MLDHCKPPVGSTCASCGRPPLLRLVATNYPDQDVGSVKNRLEAFVAPSDPRPLPKTLDLCEFCWKTLQSLIASNVYHYPTQSVEPWEEWLKPYPPGVNVLQPDGRYRSSHDLRMEEWYRKETPAEELAKFPFEPSSFKRKRSGKWPPE